MPFIGSSDVWMTKDGRPVRITDMDNDHLYNAAQWCLRKYKDAKAAGETTKAVAFAAWNRKLMDEMAKRVNVAGQAPKVVGEDDELSTPRDFRDSYTSVARRDAERRLGKPPTGWGVGDKLLPPGGGGVTIDLTLTKDVADRADRAARAAERAARAATRKADDDRAKEARKNSFFGRGSAISDELDDEDPSPIKK